jgi:hypothetical protein
MTNDHTLDIPKLNFDSSGELVLKASPMSSKNDFDFFEGKWKLHNKKLISRLNQSNEWLEF